jgi:hypothetical protein
MADEEYEIVGSPWRIVWDGPYIVGFEPDEALAHFGIVGMRWGVRRTAKAMAKSKAESSGRVGGKKISDMSDDELRAIVNRVNLERQVQALVPKTSSQKLTKAMTDMAANSVKQASSQILNAIVKEELTKALVKQGVNVPKGAAPKVATP